MLSDQSVDPTSLLRRNGGEVTQCNFHRLQLINLIFVCPWIANKIPNYSQQDATFFDLFISTDALHVSGGSSAHHQEHKNVKYSLQLLLTNTAASC